MFAAADLRKAPVEFFRRATLRTPAPGYRPDRKADRIKGAEMMKHAKRPGRVVTTIAALSLLVQPSAPIVAAAGLESQAATNPAAPATDSSEDNAPAGVEAPAPARRPLPHPPQ